MATNESVDRVVYLRNCLDAHVKELNSCEKLSNFCKPAIYYLGFRAVGHMAGIEIDRENLTIFDNLGWIGTIGWTLANFGYYVVVNPQVKTLQRELENLQEKVTSY